MVVIIEDITDQAHDDPNFQKEHQSENKEQVTLDKQESHSTDEWVEVNADDAVNPPENHCDDQQKSDLNPLLSAEQQDREKSNDENTIETEDFAEKLHHADKYKSQGNTYFAEGDMDNAIECYSQALDEAPLSASVQRAIYFANRAACHMHLEEYSEAAIDCSAALDLNPTYVKALVRRSAAFEGMGDLEGALVDLKKVLELEPNNSSAVKALKRVEPAAEKKREEMKEEMMGKLKDLGNTILGKFGMSLDNFKAEKDPETGSYSIKFQQ